MGTLVEQTKKRLQPGFVTQVKKGTLPCSDTNAELPKKVVEELTVQKNCIKQTLNRENKKLRKLQTKEKLSLQKRRVRKQSPRITTILCNQEW